MQSNFDFPCFPVFLWRAFLFFLIFWHSATSLSTAIRTYVSHCQLNWSDFFGSEQCQNTSNVSCVRQVYHCTSCLIWKDERLFFCLTMESLWVVDRDVSTTTLLVFIRRWGRFLRVAICSMLGRCYWCISILIIIPSIWCFSLIGPLCGWSAVVLFDRRYSSFRNFDSTICIDVIRMKSYMDSLFDPTCVPVGVTINKLNFLPNRKMPRFVSVFRNCGGLRTSKPYISVAFFYRILTIALPVSPMYTLPHSHGIL